MLKSILQPMLKPIMTGVFGGGVPWTLSDLGSNAFAFYDMNSGITNAGSGKISSWNDALGTSARNITQGTGANRPTLTADGVYFNKASSDFLFNSNPFMLNSTNGVIVMAILSAPPATVATPQEWILTEASTTSTNPNIVILAKDSVAIADYGKTTQALRNDENTSIVTFGGNTHATDAFTSTFNLLWNRYSKISNNFTSSINGVTGASPVSFTLSGIFTLDRFSLGALVRSSNLNYSTVTIKGLAILDASISDADIQRAEGYLAHLYSQTALLPSDHPYKTSPPLK